MNSQANVDDADDADDAVSPVFRRRPRRRATRSTKSSPTSCEPARNGKAYLAALDVGIAQAERGDVVDADEVFGALRAKLEGMRAAKRSSSSRRDPADLGVATIMNRQTPTDGWAFVLTVCCVVVVVVRP